MNIFYKLDYIDNQKIGNPVSNAHGETLLSFAYFYKLTKFLFFNFDFSSISGLDVFALTCPGFPGYCSESFPGQTCVVVCSKGRNNVPLCQVCSGLGPTHFLCWFVILIVFSTKCIFPT